MMLIIMMMSVVVVMLVYSLFFVFFLKMDNTQETMSMYECGFDPHSLTRMTFSYRFYLISILFIIFDVEISLMLPIPFLVEFVVGVIVIVMFIFVLLLGLIYEYYCGSLSWMNDYN